MRHAIQPEAVSRQIRRGEGGRIPPRSRRVLERGDGRWFFKTREGALIGAFRNELDAEKGVRDFVDFMVSAPPDVVSRFTQHLCFDATDAHFRHMQTQARSPN